MSRTTLARIVAASCDDTTEVRSTGAVAALQLREADITELESASHAYLTLQHMRGTFDAAVFRLLLGTDEIFLGSVALYGLRNASLPQADGSSKGLTSHLDLTAHARQLINALRSAEAPLPLVIRPHHPLPEGVAISIERISMWFERR